MIRTLKGAHAALARLIVRIGPAGMIAHIQHVGDARGHSLDLRCHPLFQGHVRHATSLAPPFEPDIGRVVLDIDQGNMPAVGGHGRVDLFLQKLLDGLALRRFPGLSCTLGPG